MYPRNAASPPSVLIGEVVQISDGAVQTTGVSVRVKTGSGAWGAGAGTLACDTTSGVWEYTPTQAETNGDTIKIAIYKSACLGASATLVTTAEATAGTVKLGAAQTTDITGSLSGSVGSVTGNVGGSVASVTGNVGGNVVGSVASVTAGVTLANTAHGGAAATLTLQTLTVSNSAGNAVVFESTGGSGHGLCATGEGGGSGIVALGGSTGKGLFAEGGATTGHGAYFRAHGADSYGALFLGGASGAAGAYFDSSSAGPGIAADITGDLTGNVSGSVGSVTGNVGGSVGSVTGGINTGAGTITTLDALDTAQDTQHSTTQSAISALNDPTAAAIADAVWDEATSGHATAGTTGKALTDVLADTNELQTNQGNWLTATGFSTHSAADVWSVATRVLTAATNITSDGSAITMSSSGVVGTVNLVNTTTTNTDMVSAAPSAASIADAVWDEATSGHTTAGTTGKALTDAGSAGDPWSTALPGAYGAGTAGFLVGTYIDAAISDTATAASVAALNDLSTADIDARLAAYDPPTNAEMVAAFTEIKGATWSSATDTLEAIRDRGDSAWTTATGFSTLDAAGVRTAIGLAAANLDTQLADIPTVAEFNARTLAAADYFDPAADTVANVTTVGTVNALAANAVNATALATDAVAEIQSGLATSAAISALNDLSAADVATALATYDAPTKAELDAGLAALNDLSATQVATAVWNAATADYGTAGTYGELLETNLDAAVSTAGGDSAATIWSYATRVLTAATNISGPVADAVWDEIASGHTTAGTTGKALTDILEDTNELQTNQGNWLTATGFSTHSAADVWSVATRVLTAATNITSDGSAITMSSSGVVGTVNLVNTTTTNTDMRGTDSAYTGTPPSVADIADGVWDEPLSGHSTAGTAGKALTDAGSAGDPWSTALPGAYGAGTAGYLVGTYVDAAISDTATAASVAALNDLSPADIDARLAAYGIPTVAELNARTLAAADYFDPATDTVASVTTVGTVNALAANSITSTVLATDCITSGKIATDAIGASELSAAAINAIQNGLATAANQATIIANQDTIADYIDTEVGSIKAVTDKLDTTLVQDGVVYDFTAAALAAAPSGGGGGGDATAANQTTIIAHLTDIKGATWDSSNSLEAVSDAIAALDVGSGGGPKAVTITVTDGTDPLDTAQVSVYLSGVLKATGSTNDSGQFVANVASSGTFDVVATFDGHHQASAVTFNAATDSTAAVALTALSITPAPSGYTTGWLYSYDENGDIEASISYRYRPVSPNAAATGESLSPDWNTVTSDVNGKVEFPKMRLGVTYEYQRVGNERQVGKFKVPTTAGATTPLPQII